MRILHTSDWHVGKTIRGRDRSDEHRAVLAEIAAIARAEETDLVVVAGDVFETSSPSADAERIAFRALLDLAETAEVVVVCGNHDNERRLQALEPLLGLGRIAARALPASPDQGGVVRIRTRSGEEALVALVPFLHKHYVLGANEVMGMTAADLEQRFAERVRQILGLMTAPFERSDATVNVLVAHLACSDGVPESDLLAGVRAVHAMLEYCVSPAAIPTTPHYTALGHFHRAAELRVASPVWYCGSPLALDFGEPAEPKHVLVVDASPGTPAAVRKVPLATGRRLRTIEGTIEQLREAAGTTGEDWLRLRVRGQARAGLREEIFEAFGEAAVEVQVVGDAAHAPEERAARAGRSHHDLFVEYLTERGAQDERVVELFDRLLEEVTRAPA